MANARDVYNVDANKAGLSDPQNKQFDLSFPYLSSTHVSVTVNGTATTAFTFATSTRIQLNTGPTAGDVVVIKRATSPNTRLVDYQTGSVLSDEILDRDSLQAFYLAQEANDVADIVLSKNASNLFDAGNERITNVANPTAAQDVATKNYLESTWLSSSDKTQLNALNTTNLNTVAGSVSNVNTVAGAITNVNTVAGKTTEITALGTSANVSNMGTLAASGVVGNIASVAGISSNVTTVAGKASLITSDFVSDLNQLAVTDVINDINLLAKSDVVSDLNQLATSDFVSDLNQLATTTNVNNISTVAGIAANVTSVAGVASNVTTVAGISSAVSTVAADGSDIGTVAGISSAVSTVSSNNANVSAVAGAVSNVNTVAGAVSNVNTVAGAVSNVNTVAGISSAVSTVAADTTDIGNVSGSIANVNTVASNISGVNSFAEQYRIGSSDPTGSLDEGDLFYNTTANQLKIYNGTQWENAAPAGSGFLAASGGTMTGNLALGDNVKAVFGASADLAVFHDGLNSYVSDTGTGDIIVKGDYVRLQDSGGTNLLTADGNDAVSLFYAGGSRLSTTASGAHISGALSATTSMTVQNGGGTEGVQLRYNENGGEIALYGTSGNTKLLIDYLDGNNDGNGLARYLNLGAGSDGVQVGVANASNTGGVTFTTGNNVTRQHINAIGDIFNYKTDGSTVGVHWDASEGDLNVSGTVQADKFNNDEALPDVRPSLLLDFANSKTLDPRITFTRGSTASYYDGVTTAKAEENLMKYSQDVSNASWYKNGSTITANNTTAPDGTTTADKVQISTPTNYSGISQLITVKPLTTYAGTLYVKKSTQDYIIVGFNSLLANNTYIGTHALNRTNLTNGGQVGSDIGTTTTTDVGNGWYKVTFVCTTAINSVIGQFIVEFSNSSGASNTGTSIGTDKGIYVWGAQLEQRSAVTAYTPTTSAPVVNYQPVLQTAASGVARFDHDPLTGESKGLLVEEARTNLAYPSNQQSGTGLSRITQNTTGAIAPDGTQTASIVRETTETGAHHIFHTIVGETANTVHTASVYLKNYGVSDVSLRMRISDSGDVYKQVFFDLDNSAVSFSGDAGYTGTITDVGNGWRRCTITGDVGDGTNDLRVHVFACQGTGTVSSYTGNGWDGFGYWGLQVEAGNAYSAFATSYIPTTGAAASRAVEFASVGGADFSKSFRAQSSTLYCEFGKIHAGDTVIGERLVTVYPANDPIVKYSLEGFRAEVKSDAAYAAVGFSNATRDGGIVALGFDLTGFSGSSNGANAISVTAIPTAKKAGKMYIGSAHAFGHANCGIKKVAVYPKRLSNATLKAMTTE